MRTYRNLLTAVLLTIGTLTYAQNKSVVKMPVNEETKLITYEKVQEVAGVNQAELYQRGLQWCMTYFKNPTDVIRSRDSIGGTIVCKARFKISNPPDKKGLETDAGLVQYTLNLMFKDGRYRYVLTEINWKQQSYYGIEKWMDTSNQYYKTEFEYYLQQSDDKVKELLKDLDKGMKMAPKAKASDW
jgi:hypothetical protein